MATSSFEPAEGVPGLAKALEQLPKVLEDAAYVSVGFGVLAFQRAQVRRRELEGQLAELATAVRRAVNGDAS